MSELTTIEVKCRTCKLMNTFSCGSSKCVSCVVNKVAGKGCGSIDPCRFQVKHDLDKCRLYVACDWDI